MVSTDTLLALGAGLAVSEASGVTNFVGGQKDNETGRGGGQGDQIITVPGGGGMPGIEMPSVEFPKFAPEINLQSPGGLPASVAQVLQRQSQQIQNLENKVSGNVPSGYERARLALLEQIANTNAGPSTQVMDTLLSMERRLTKLQTGGVPNIPGGNGDSSGSEYHLHKQGFSNPVKATFELASESGEFVANNPGTTLAGLAAPFTGGSSLLLVGPAFDVAMDNKDEIARGADITADIATGNDPQDTVNLPGPTLAESARATKNAWDWATPGNQKRGPISDATKGAAETWNWATPNVNQISVPNLGTSGGQGTEITKSQRKRGKRLADYYADKAGVETDTGGKPTNVPSEREKARKQLQKMNRKRRRAARGVIR